MDTLIGICEQFSKEFSIQFNATKSRHLFFGSKRKDTYAQFQMQGSTIPKVNSEKHLGNFIGQDNLRKSIERSITELYVNTNMLMTKFAKCSITIKYKLFKSYCMSVYGSQLWDFSSKLCDKLYTAWRKCIRRLLGLPYNTHSRFLHIMCNDINVEQQLQMRCINFVMSCNKSKSDSVHMCYKLAINGSRSSLSKSWFHISTDINANPANA